MRTTRQSSFLEEAITGAIGIFMVTLFLGFMAVDIGSIPLFIVTAIVLAMAFVDFVQTVREARRRSDDDGPEQ